MCEVINSGTYTVWVATIDKLLAKCIAIMIIMCLRNIKFWTQKDPKGFFEFYVITYKIHMALYHVKLPTSTRLLSGCGATDAWWRFACRDALWSMAIHDCVGSLWFVYAGVPGARSAKAAASEYYHWWDQLLTYSRFSLVCHLQLSHVCIKAFHAAVRALNGFIVWEYETCRSRNGIAFVWHGYFDLVVYIYIYILI